jgi:hypothetical protein
LPAGNAQTPLITRFEPRKVPLRSGGDEIIAAPMTKLQKFSAHDCAYQMQANILIIGLAATIPKETSEWVKRAGHEWLTKDITHNLGHLFSLLPLPIWRTTA